MNKILSIYVIKSQVVCLHLKHCVIIRSLQTSIQTTHKYTPLYGPKISCEIHQDLAWYNWFRPQENVNTCRSKAELLVLLMSSNFNAGLN